jgi:hypothetical protein
VSVPIKIESEIDGVVWGLRGNTASVSGVIKMNGIIIFHSEMPIWDLDGFDFHDLDEQKWTNELIRDFGLRLNKG